MFCELFLKYFRDYDEIEETYDEIEETYDEIEETCDDENYFDKAVKILYKKERD